MRLGGVIAVLSMMMCSRRDVSSELAGLNLKDSSGRFNVGSVVVVCQIVAGLGEVGWGLSIADEVERISNGKATLVFCGASESVVRFLSRVKKVEHIKSLKKLRDWDVEENTVYVCSRNVSKMRVNALRKRYDLVITFHIRRDEKLNKEIIDVMEYGNSWGGGAKMLFKNYGEEYEDGVRESEGYVRVCESPREFGERISRKGMGEFRKDYLGKLIPSGPYHFTYFAYVSDSLDGKMLILRFFCKQLHDFMRSAGAAKEEEDREGTLKPDKNTMTVLTNGDIRKWVEDEVERRKVRLQNGRLMIGSEGEAEVKKVVMEEHMIAEEEDEFIIYLNTKEIDVRVKVVSYEQLSPSEFEYVLLKSERVVGCTGDISLSQVLSSGRVPIYECLEHNRNFLTDLVRRWKEATDQTGSEVGFRIHQWEKLAVGYFGYYPEFWKDYEKFIKALKEDSFQKWLYKRFKKRMIMKSAGMEEIDSKLEERMIAIPFDEHKEDLESINEKTLGGIDKAIEELRKSGNNIGECLLEGRRIPKEMMKEAKISKVKECIEETVERLDKIHGATVVKYRSRVVGTLEECLRAVEECEIRAARRLMMVGKECGKKGISGASKESGG